ncbi:MAG: choice-of-anchor I family protein, partial [Cyanobacteria bacterium P01_H01_bin.26]
MADFLERIGSFTSDIGAEITAYDPTTQTVFLVSGGTEVQAVSLADPSSPSLVGVLDVADFIPGIDGVNSVAVSNGLVAIAIGADPETDPGFVAIADINAVVAGDTSAFAVVQVGSLPDMVTFTPDGTQVLSANEGEPGDDFDPNGSVSIIDVANGVASVSQDSVTTLGFEAFNGSEDALRAEGVRIFPDNSVSQDVEPEYIAVSQDGTQAFVTLQENNAVAVVNLETQEIEGIVPLGLKDHSQAGNGLDASDRDGGINIDTEPVFGMYMPDSIASFEVDGQTYYITANEGDARDEDARISDLVLDPEAFPDAAELQQDENLGRLEA